MRMNYVAAMLLASTNAAQLGDAKDLDDKETKLSQSFASAFNMEPPKLMTTKPLPQGAKDGCPTPGQMLTNAASGGAFLDGCYMNTTRSQDRNERTGEEAQSYLYMWKHACAFTKWVPSNQFMYSNLDYDADTMTLERFGFIGMDKRCFWGSIGVLWKRPLPVEQILPNTTVEVEIAKPKPAPKHPPVHPPVKKPIKKAPKFQQEGQLFNTKSKKGDCLGVNGKTILIKPCAKDNSDTWTMKNDGQLVHKKTGMCVTPSGKNNGNKISLGKCTGTATQKWKMNKTKGKKFVFENIKNKNTCIDLPWFDGNRGRSTQVW